MRITIENIEDIGKLLGAVRLACKGEVRIAAKAFTDVWARFQVFLEQNDMSLQAISPSGNRLMICTAGGAIVGAAIGFFAGALPGALVGALSGGAAGYFTAHITIAIGEAGGGDYVSLTLG